MRRTRNSLSLLISAVIVLHIAGCGGLIPSGAPTTPPSSPPSTTNGQWTWEGGANVINQPGTYGTEGVSAAANTPGAREAALTWTDASGNFWMFGGMAASIPSDSYLNDIWKYSNGQWTWMGGSSTYNQAGVYGTLGTPDPNNIPEARAWAVHWKDGSGNLWLFGGLSPSGLLNDLWRYSAGEWTWMGGSNPAALNQPANYGVLGTAAASNQPGERSDAASWIDSAGNFWLFGGFGYDSTGTLGYLNDLWKFSSGEWTWMSGSNVAGDAGSYGTLGVASPTNVPGARMDAAAWVDAEGNIWLFGGDYFEPLTTTGKEYALNDMWKYSGGEWTWMGGSNQADQPATYGSEGVAATGNVPGAISQAVTWTDAAGNFWLFAGFGIAPTTECRWPTVLWKYSSGEWTWVDGPEDVDCSLPSGEYGILGVGDAQNHPGSRVLGSGWTDSSGNLWLFGGNGVASTQTQGYLNDLWKFEP
jgi:Galactose oxidase, central domain